MAAYSASPAHQAGVDFMAPSWPCKSAAFEGEPATVFPLSLSLHTPSLSLTACPLPPCICCALVPTPLIFELLSQLPPPHRPPSPSTCFIFPVVALLAVTLHCLGLIRHWSKREETDLNYPFYSLTASPLALLNSISEPFIYTHTHIHPTAHTRMK